MSIVRKAVIPAAGMGTRFLPATKALPKEMLPIIDTPVIQYVVSEAVASGIEDIIIITGRGKRAIEDHFDQSFELEYVLKQKCQLEMLGEIQKISEMANIHYIRQKEPLGLGHAILQARHHVGNEPFAVLLGDEIFRSTVPVTKQLIECYNRIGTTILGVRRVKKSDVTNYGIIKPVMDATFLIKVLELVEKPSVQDTPSNLAIIGRYIIEPQIFDILQNIPTGCNDEIQLTDALQVMKSSKDIYAMEVQGDRYDVGNRLGYLQAIVESALEREELCSEFQSFIKKLKLKNKKRPI